MTSDYSRGAPRELTASDAWTRGLLILMSIGIAMLTALAAFGSLLSIDPQDHVPAGWFLPPAGAAALGVILAVVGGAWSRPQRWTTISTRWNSLTSV